MYKREKYKSKERENIIETAAAIITGGQTRVGNTVENSFPRVLIPD